MMLCKADFEDLFPDLFCPETPGGSTKLTFRHGRSTGPGPASLEDEELPRKKHKLEEIVSKLRRADVLVSQGRSAAEATQ